LGTRVLPSLVLRLGQGKELEMGLIRGLYGLVSGLLGAVVGVVSGLLRGVLALVLALLATVLLVVAAVLCITILLLPLGIPLGALSVRLYGQALQLVVPGSSSVERILRRGEDALRIRGNGFRRLRKRLALR
jgi:ABC-type dipeptide/oligopeptide/nickel transport system permease subunit